MNANNDNEISQELSAYLDGELNEADTAKVQKALSESSELSRELNQLKNMREMLRNLPKTTAPDGFATRAMAAAEKSATRRGSKKIPVWVWGSAVAAAIIILAVTVSYYPLLIKSKTSGTKVAQQTQPKKIGEIARDLKADKELEFNGAKKGISRKRSSVVSGPMGGAKPKSFVATKGGIAVEESRGLKKPATDRMKSADISLKPARRSKLNLGFDSRFGTQGKGGAVTQRLAEKRVAELAAENRRGNNEIVWTDNIKAEKKNVEKLLLSNGLQIVPESQDVLESNQAMNLSSNRKYNADIGRPVAMNGKEVEYLVYATPKQVSKISKELREKVQMRQTVSQLPEHSYRNAIFANADSSDVSLGLPTTRLRERAPKNAPLEKAEATPKAKLVEAVPSSSVQRTKAKTQQEPAKPQQVAMMITLRYRPQEQLNPKQTEAITNLERLNRMPLSQKRATVVESLVESGAQKATTSKPAKPTAAPASQPTAK